MQATSYLQYQICTLHDYSNYVHYDTTMHVYTLKFQYSNFYCSSCRKVHPLEYEIDDQWTMHSNHQVTGVTKSYNRVHIHR